MLSETAAWIPGPLHVPESGDIKRHFPPPLYTTHAEASAYGHAKIRMFTFHRPSQGSTELTSRIDVSHIILPASCPNGPMQYLKHCFTSRTARVVVENYLSTSCIIYCATRRIWILFNYIPQFCMERVRDHVNTPKHIQWRPNKLFSSKAFDYFKTNSPSWQLAF